VSAAAEDEEKEIVGARSIEKRLVVPCSVDDLYGSFTTNAGVVAFFAPEAFVEARVGGPYELYFSAEDEVGPFERGTEGCVVRALEPGRRLTVSWSLPPEFPLLRGQKRRTELTFGFEPDQEEGARLTLTHAGFRTDDEPRAQREWDDAFRYFTHIWAVVLSRLVRRWKSGPIDWSAT
jgi:uncharacterized protein YndB with AHSA1/START domain